MTSTNKIVANAMAAHTTRDAERVARNAKEDVNASLKEEIGRLSRRISDELKNQSETYAFWMEANCGRWATNLLEEAKRNKDVEPSLIEEIKKLRRRVDDAIAASKKLPR